MVLSHPDMEDYVVLPQDDKSLSRWCYATWIHLLVEKHAWLSAGLIWLPEASATGRKAILSGEQQGKTESTPTINLFEHWEDGAELPKSVDARHYHFPSCFAIACPWNYSPKAVSLNEAVDSLTLISQGGVANNSVGPGSRYPNQPDLLVGSDHMPAADE